MKASETYRHPIYRRNCAQAIGCKYAQLYGMSESEATDRFATCAAGGAPGGLCGALYALMMADPEKADERKELFALQTGGHITCRALKSEGHVPCKTSIDIADQILGGEDWDK